MRIAAVVAVLIPTGLATAGGWLWYQLKVPPPAVPGGAILLVHAGQPFAQTAMQLEAGGVVRSSLALRLWGRWIGNDRQVHAGDYRFEKPLRAVDVIHLMNQRAAGLHKVTIPEGSTVRDVANLLAAAGFGGSDQFLCLTHDASFLDSLNLPASGAEGYLFPDTYSFPWSETPAEILRTMALRFRDNAAALDARRAQSGMRQADMVTLASIIEKETG
ncbi:MAG TPA: endolytic transglycosylase MltG, partial [Candidatus Acidoferrales bacterium]|nr:endolytic transglycosylase MltG [Candidatus Acidoferrales bacterium]